MIAGTISLAALAVVLASLVYLHLVPTQLSPVRNAVSQYGISAFRGGYRVATIAFAVAGLALAVGVDQALGSGRRNAVVALLVVFAIARAAISWFPMDAPGAERTSTGTAHWLLAIVAFGCVTSAAFRLGGILSDGGRWHGLAQASTTLGWLMLVCLLCMAFARFSPLLAERFGAVERAFYLCAIAWTAVFAIACASNIR